MTQSLEDILRGDAAFWVADHLSRYWHYRLAKHKDLPPAFAQELLAALEIAASGRAPDKVIPTSWISVHDAAARYGASENRIRQLARSRAIIATKRFGRDWQIDENSLPRR